MHKPSLNRALFAVLLTTSTVLAGLPQTAGATTLMDLLRGRSEERRQPAPAAEIIPPAQLRDPEPIQKVAAPRYYTYKADSRRTIGIKPPEMPIPVLGTDHDLAVAHLAMSQVKVEATPDIAQAVENYYNNKGALIWTTDTAVTDKAKSAVAALATADTAGLEPADYAVKMPEGLDTMPEDARRQALMAFELSLSAKILTYVQDTVRGRLDPNRISGYHDFKRKTVNLDPVLDLVRTSPDIGAYLHGRDPANPQFMALKAELAKLTAEGSQQQVKPVKINLTGVLKPGGSNPQLANIVEGIKAYGSDALKTTHALTLTNYTGTPDYTPELVALVEDYQKERGLKPDGVIGQGTVRTMVGHSNADKIEKLVVAMEQMRWLPADLGPRYVFINQPAFEAYYFNDRQQQIAMKVVVGAPQHQTFFFQNMIQTVEFNPYWGVPRSIIVNEMLPKLRQDPSYLDRQGYEVSYKGRKMPSSSIDWSTNPDVDVRQPPSSDNALGDLKILFPNAHAIYMHDTPAKSFFKRDMRALSHGCVRLAEPRVMAAAVMGTTVDDIDAQIASGQNRAVQVPQKFPVYVAYFTAWPDKDGVIRYYDDVYSRDEATRKAFDVTSTSRGVQS
ncbi:L,D-transpeptidase family protein [Allorhizobium taibaishanense]|uniref:Murein L,D-transpeptidase YcbB/YkuD n=1 Tax=Allorhizobium taibaishanense TaxID=887144 RepID=A0A1Q9A0V7_9HYPH|nr:L,D-transpeptidase family protein [Allorhizobium taibaishanense]MBB4007874.1 murein L,D-transpeptidase YcbB/YkuD [Allorhizobium taibaishanense]OLP48202.1 peptidoglycan-binding protein [Allorhizobium taibaishanense]